MNYELRREGGIVCADRHNCSGRELLCLKFVGVDSIELFTLIGLLQTANISSVKSIQSLESNVLNVVHSVPPVSDRHCFNWL